MYILIYLMYPMMLRYATHAKSHSSTLLLVCTKKRRPRRHVSILLPIGIYICQAPICLMKKMHFQYCLLCYVLEEKLLFTFLVIDICYVKMGFHTFLILLYLIKSSFCLFYHLTSTHLFDI